MKKKLILSFGMIGLAVLSLVACNRTHDHKYDGYSFDDKQHWQLCTETGCSEIINKEDHRGGTATETEKAICEVCGESYGSLKAPEHIHAYTVTKVEDVYLVSAATCESPAVYAKSCECGEKGTETFTSGEALSHNMVTKNNETHHWSECDREGCEEKTEEIAHEEKHATCNEDAVCSCGKVVEVKHHSWGEWTTKSVATCTEKEVEHRVCTVAGCDAEETRDGDPALTHNMVNIYDDEAHWTECDREGCEEATTKVPHTWDEGVVTTQPTVQEDGVKTFNCTGCEATKEEPIAKLSHTHIPSTSWVSDGSQHWKTCSGCSEKIELTNHTEEVIPGEEATCLAPGKEDGKKCNVCEKVLLEQAPIAQLEHSYTGEYVDNEDGTHSQKCVNGCTGKSVGVAHTHSVLEVVSQSATGGEFKIKCVCGNAHSLTVNGQTDCDVELVELSDKLVLRATLKEAVISNLQTTLPTVHADVISALEAWSLDIAPTEQMGFEKYIVYVGGKEATVEEQAPGDNNYQFKVAIRKDETMKIYKEGTPIKLGDTTEVAYTATKDGIYTIYVNSGDQIWVDPTVSGIPYSSYSLKVNGEAVTNENLAGSTEYAKFVVTLQANDVLVVLGDTTELLSYTATKEGEHTVVVDKNNAVTVTDPDVVMESITFHYYNNLNWTSVNLYAWVDKGPNFAGGWPGSALTEEADGWWTITIEAESFDGLMVIFNGSGGQTPDSTYVDGLDYYFGKSSTGYSTAQEAIEASETVVVYDYYVRGTMNGWTGSEPYGLEKNGEEYVITLELEADAQFKIVADATAWNKGDWGYSNVESGCKSLVSDGGGGNIKVNSAGTYTIYFKTNTHSMWISKA